MKKTFNARSNLHKGTVVGHHHHTTFDLRSFNEIFRQGIPWVRRELLHAKSDALLFVVEVQNHHVDLLVNFHHLFRVTHTAVAHVGDVHQTVDTAQVHKHPVRGDVLDHAFENLTHFETLDDEALLLFELSFDQGFV